jgi:hypothetical protein
MKHIKSYNESIRQYLKPKSNEEILDKLSKLYDNEKIETIIKYQLDYSLLPRNEEGFCVYDGDLYINNKNLTKLPDNLVVNGYLDCKNNSLTKLPDNLTIKGSLDCSNNELTELPDNLVVKNCLYCNYNQLTELPDNLIVNGRLDCSNNKILELPNNLVVKGSLVCNTLPENIEKPKGVNRIII